MARDPRIDSLSLVDGARRRVRFVTILPEFRGLELATLRSAIAIYLELAYSSGSPPPVVAERLHSLDGDADVSQLVLQKPFEHSRNAAAHMVFSLRLGNERYPHMKLQVQTWPTSVGYLFSVNAHDQAQGMDASMPGMDEFRVIQEHNQTLKEAIERA